MESRLFAYGGTWAGKDVYYYVAMFLMVAHTGEDGRGFDDVVIYSGNWAAACPRIGFKGQIGISYQPPPIHCQRENNREKDNMPA